MSTSLFLLLHTHYYSASQLRASGREHPSRLGWGGYTPFVLPSFLSLLLSGFATSDKELNSGKVLTDEQSDPWQLLHRLDTFNQHRILVIKLLSRPRLA